MAPAAKGPKPQGIPRTPSNSIHIGTCSIDGNACVYSLIDPDDVVLRKFGRPLQAVGLSPDFRNDRTYLSGGLAGNLILTVGGKAGKSETANTNGLAAASSNWLGSIGLGNQTGVDKTLHSGEGSISTIKWSLSGRYVAWVNEYGIKIMRSCLGLDSGDVDFAWKRIVHVDRPNSQGWEEMAGVWKARAEWISEDGLEDLEEDQIAANGTNNKHDEALETQSIRSNLSFKKTQRSFGREKLLVGWGGTIWIIHVHPPGSGGKNAVERKIGRVEVVSKYDLQIHGASVANTPRLRTDGIISGVSLYTPNLLVVLVYISSHGNQTDPEDPQGTLRKGISKRQNALQPEMRIIHIDSQEETSADTLNVSRFESLTAADYHLGVLPVIRTAAAANAPRGALELMSGIGETVWDAGLYPGKLLGNAAIDATMYSARLFASGAGSVRSTRSISTSGEKRPTSKGISDESTLAPSPLKGGPSSGPNPHPSLLTRGMKIFIQSPYDSVLATKPTVADHLAWLVEHERYEEAYSVLDAHPEAAAGLPMHGSSENSAAGTPSTPTKAPDSLVDFFDDSQPSSPTSSRQLSSHVDQKKQRVGQKWVQQLVTGDHWEMAGQVCGRVLRTASSWEHWVWVFAEADKHDDICPFIPTTHLRPPLSSTVYEVMLGHYVSNDRPKLARLLEKWPFDLFDVKSVILAIESRLRYGDIKEDSVEGGVTGRDWRILMNGLAKLFLADGRARDALRCYLKAQDADMALDLIRNQHLIDAVAEDIPRLIMLRIPKEKLKDLPISELEELSAEPVQVLSSEAHHGVVLPETVVKQLSARKDMRPFLFFYFRALWTGTEQDDTSQTRARRRRAPSMAHLADEGKLLVNDFADTALDLLAEYDRPLLFDFLKSSPSYTLSKASALCERRGYLPELVHLLAKEGRAKRALTVILDQLADVPQALAFARDQADPELWDDLVAHALHKPALLRALLAEVGAAGLNSGASADEPGPAAHRAVIDPVALVRRIPAGLEIEGLRGALARLLREFELQHSISAGVARVLRGEVAARMDALRAGQKRGLRFETRPPAGAGRARSAERRARRTRRKVRFQDVRPGSCCGCGQVFRDEEPDPDFDPLAPPPVPLIAFPCSHAFHLTCLLSYADPAFERPARVPPSISPPGSPAASPRPMSPKGGAPASPKSPSAASPKAAAHKSPPGRAAAKGVLSPRLEDPAEYAEPAVPAFDARVREALAHPEYAGIGYKVSYAKVLRRAEPSLMSAGCPLEWEHEEDGDPDG